MISMVVVLPAPFGPSRPKQMPSGTLKDTPVHRGDGGILLDQITDFEDRLVHGSWQESPANTGARS